jgi:uncharacterized membrane protein YfcA
MAESRKRHGHHPHHKPADIPARQRTTGSFLWALLFAVFGLLIAFFAAGVNYIALVIGVLVSGAIGYYIGKKMEEDVSKK